MPAILTIRNEGTTRVVIRKFEGPIITEGEIGLAKVLEKTVVPGGEQRGIIINGYEYISIERNPDAPLLGSDYTMDV